MSDPRYELIEALQVLMRADATVTAVVKAVNIVIDSPIDGKTAEVKPRINFMPGGIDRLEERSGERVYIAEVILEMTANVSELNTSNIREIINVVAGNKDAFMWDHKHSVAGITSGDSAKLIDNAEILGERPTVDPVTRTVTALYSFKFNYQQVTT